MKKFSKIIVLMGMLAMIVGIFTAMMPQNAEAADCKVESATFSPVSSSDFPGHKYLGGSSPTITATVTTKACSGKNLFLSIRESANDITEIDNVKFTVPASETFSLAMKAGESSCNSILGIYDCNYQIIVAQDTGWTLPVFRSTGTPNGNLKYECDGVCLDSWSVIPQEQTANGNIVTSTCNIESAAFHANTSAVSSLTKIRSVDNPGLEITLKTSGCDGWTGNIDLTETGALTHNNSALIEPMKFTFDNGSQTRIPLIPGETNCRDEETPNCHIRATITPYLLSVTPAKTGEPFIVTPNTLDYDCKDAGFNGKAKCDAKYLWSKGTLSDLGDLELKTEVTGDQGNSITLDNGASTVDVNSSCYDKAKGAMIPGCYAVYSGLADILNKTGNKLSVITDATSLGDFLNGIIAVVIGLAGVAAVVMIMYHGFTYMKSDNVSFKTETRGKIVKTVLGLLLLLTMYTILRTINPDLLTLVPNFDSAALSGGVQLTPQQFEQVTGEKLGTPSQYDAMAKDIATKYNSDYCALRVIMQNETRGNAALVGQDENAPVDISSRKAFVKSGQKFSGATFSPTDALITDHKFCNDATKSCIGNAPNPDSPTLGLDWRFSKGIGLTQITFYPDGYKTNYTANPANKGIAPSRTFDFPDGSMTVSPKDVFKPEKNLEISAKLWNAGMAKCNDQKGAFNTYMCGDCSCSGAYATKEVSERTSQYNQCKAEDQKPA